VSDGTSGTTTAYYNQGGVIYKSGSIRFSLVDKWTGVQYAIDETSLGGGINQLNRKVRIAPYNTAILAASYEWHNLRFGLTVIDLFNSTKYTDISLSGTGPTTTTLNTTSDQVYFQLERQVMGDITVRF